MSSLNQPLIENENLQSDHVFADPRLEGVTQPNIILRFIFTFIPISVPLYFLYEGGFLTESIVDLEVLDGIEIQMYMVLIGIYLLIALMIFMALSGKHPRTLKNDKISPGLVNQAGAKKSGHRRRPSHVRKLSVFVQDPKAEVNPFVNK